MIIRHSLYYLLARGLPGLVNFAALSIYTRLLSPEDFGRYSLLIAGIGLAQVVIFQWLKLVILRFLKETEEESSRFLSEVLGVFLSLATFTALIVAGAILLWQPPSWSGLLVLGLALLIVEAWFEINLTLARARLQPMLFGKLQGARVLIALFIGSILAWQGLGSAAPAIGLLVGYAAAFVLMARKPWTGIAPQLPRRQSFQQQLRYGLPLALSSALAWVNSGLDRLLLGWLAGESSVGLYSAGYDLVFQAITLVLVIINTASFPIILNTLAEKGRAEASRELSRNGEVILCIGLTGAVLFSILGTSITTLFVGEEFRSGVNSILPLLAAASALAGIKAYHFDLAFHLANQTRWLVLTSLIAALTNIVLNLLLIPSYGIQGAAWATLTAYILALLVSMQLGRRIFIMPGAMAQWLKGGLAAATAGGTAWLGTRVVEGVLAQLALGLILSLVGILIAAYLGNIANFRKELFLWWGSRAVGKYP